MTLFSFWINFLKVKECEFNIHIYALFTLSIQEFDLENIMLRVSMGKFSDIFNEINLSTDSVIF